MNDEDNDIVKQRRARLAELRGRGVAYPNDWKREHLAGRVYEHYRWHDQGYFEQRPERVRLAGRMTSRRIMGKAAFAHLRDMSGSIQLYVQRDKLADGVYEDFKCWDIGDLIGVEGLLMKTRKGELSARAEEIRLLAKCLRPLPEKYHGLVDQETRYRQRYLDLIASDDTRRVFQLRSQVTMHLREFLRQRGFMEVETPMMHALPGGAAARPFVTHHNALDMDLYLRVAPELHLKRLLVGGLEQVFEINRSFRNEGLSPQHNPEFTMLEFYQAYATYEDFMTLTEELLREVARRLNGMPASEEWRMREEDRSEKEVFWCQGECHDLSKPFARLTMAEAICEFNAGVGAVPSDLAGWRTLAARLGVAVEKTHGAGKIQAEIFEKTVEAKLKGPIFITGYPVEVSPLARGNDDNPEVADRFEFFLAGREIANGFSELNDPEEQAARFRAQAAISEAGDVEAMRYDGDYIAALEYGMPPAAGEGIGVDRLVMALADVGSIRDVILFPHMRGK